MDDFNEYLDSDGFRLFQDQPLRQHACRAVEELCKNNSSKDFVKRSQLHSIPTVIQAGGLEGLRKLVKQQTEKNTNKRNEKFWSFLSSHILISSHNKDSFTIFLRDYLASFLEDEALSGNDKNHRNQIKKENKKKMTLAIDKVLPIYFEHFNCHYFYLAGQQKP